MRKPEKTVAPSTPAYDVAIVVGRWQLPHLGHDTLFQKALAIAPKVIVVIGSAFRSRDTRNPFTASERQDMILASLAPADRDRVQFLPVRDYFDDDRWNAEVGKCVEAMTDRADRIALVGFKKDHTSYYLNNFPRWTSEPVEQVVDIDATPLRNIFFGGNDVDTALTLLTPYIAPGVRAYLRAWASLPAFARLTTEQSTLVAYRKRWNAPWYMTADAVVQVAGHVLLIQRGGDVGYGLWALPGGFVNAGERFLHAAIRELKEETGFWMLPSTMKNALKSSAVFDHPLRSPRGRLVTHAFHFVFGAGNLPEVRASDDAMAVRWVPLEDLHKYEDKLFEDHAAILDHFVGLFPK